MYVCTYSTYGRTESIYTSLKTLLSVSERGRKGKEGIQVKRVDVVVERIEIAERREEEGGMRVERDFFSFFFLSFFFLFFGGGKERKRGREE